MLLSSSILLLVAISCVATEFYMSALHALLHLIISLEFSMITVLNLSKKSTTGIIQFSCESCKMGWFLFESIFMHV